MALLSSQVDALVQDAVRKGAQVALGGKKHPRGELFYEPTLLKDVTSNMDVSQQEIFGPVAAVQKYI